MKLKSGKLELGLPVRFMASAPVVTVACFTGFEGL
jgi:hypothetical protein